MDFARLELLKLLGEHPHIRTKTGNDYSDVAGITAARFLITYTCHLIPTPEEARQLSDWVAGGGMWFALHGTNVAHRTAEEARADPPNSVAPEFYDLIATQFKTHPPIGPFRVDVVDPAHPLVAGIDSFTTVDEQYLLHRYSDVHSLLETVHEDTEGESSTHPVYYIRTKGRGEIVYLTLGHCHSHYDFQPMADWMPNVERCSWNYPVYYELLRRGIRYVAGIGRGLPTP